MAEQLSSNDNEGFLPELTPTLADLARDIHSHFRFYKDDKEFKTFADAHTGITFLGKGRERSVFGIDENYALAVYWETISKRDAQHLEIGHEILSLMYPEVFPRMRIFQEHTQVRGGEKVLTIEIRERIHPTGEDLRPLRHDPYIYLIQSTLRDLGLRIPIDSGSPDNFMRNSKTGHIMFIDSVPMSFVRDQMPDLECIEQYLKGEDPLHPLPIGKTYSEQRIQKILSLIFSLQSV